MRPFYPLNECKAFQFMPMILGTKTKSITFQVHVLHRHGNITEKS